MVLDAVPDEACLHCAGSNVRGSDRGVVAPLVVVVQRRSSNPVCRQREFPHAAQGQRGLEGRVATCSELHGSRAAQQGEERGGAERIHVEGVTQWNK